MEDLVGVLPGADMACEFCLMCVKCCAMNGCRAVYFLYKKLHKTLGVFLLCVLFIICVRSAASALSVQKASSCCLSVVLLH